MSACPAWRGLLAAAALGRLLDSEGVALDAHLEGCEACRDEKADLEAVARMLVTADPARLDAGPEPPSDLTSAVFARLGIARRARARARWRRLSAVTAVAVTAVVVSVALARGGGRPVERVAFSAPAGVEATAVLEARPWGIQVVLEAAGLARGRTHSVWLERADGSRVSAGTFTAVAGRRLHVTLAAGLPRAEVVALGVSTAHGTPVLRAELGHCGRGKWVVAAGPAPGRQGGPRPPLPQSAQVAAVLGITLRRGCRRPDSTGISAPRPAPMASRRPGTTNCLVEVVAAIQPRRPRHRAHPAPAQSPRLCTHHQPPLTLVQMRPHLGELGRQRVITRNHTDKLHRCHYECNVIS